MSGDELFGRLTAAGGLEATPGRRGPILVPASILPLVSHTALRVRPDVKGLRVVDAVDDADELLLADAEHAVEPLAQLGREDLPGVGGADRGDLVGGEDAGLEEAHLPVELQPVHAEVLRPEVANQAPACRQIGRGAPVLLHGVAATLGS